MMMNNVKAVNDETVKQMYPSDYEKGYRAVHYNGDEPESTSIVECWNTRHGNAMVRDGVVRTGMFIKKIGKREYRVYIYPRDVGTEWFISSDLGRIESAQNWYTVEEAEVINSMTKDSTCRFEELLVGYFNEWLERGTNG